jgi:hypothetical protein
MYEHMSVCTCLYVCEYVYTNVSMGMGVCVCVCKLMFECTCVGTRLNVACYVLLHTQHSFDTQL